MSSPGARQRRRREQYQNPRTRSELLTAIGAGVAIVAGTGLMIWLLRPGGMADRQPRSSWLISLALIAALIVAYAIFRRDNKREMNKPVALAIGLGIVTVLAVVAGFVWPGGLLRHTPKAFTPPTNPVTAPPTTTPAGATTSTPAGATTSTPATPTTTTPTTATTKPGSTPTSAPGTTNGSTATTKPSTSPTATAPPVSPSQ